MLTEAHSPCPNPRLLIALHSPAGLRETGLSMCPTEKSQLIDRVRWWAVRSLQSGLSRKNREIRACFAYFEGRAGGISLQLRLAGGGNVIRTRITVLNPATPDVCVTCRRCNT